MAKLMPLPLTISCSSKSRLVLPSWCRLTWVVLDKIHDGRKMNVCVCVCDEQNIWAATFSAPYHTARDVTNAVHTLTVRSSRRSSVYWIRISLTSICRSFSRLCCCCTIDRSSRTQLWSFAQGLTPSKQTGQKSYKVLQSFMSHLTENRSFYSCSFQANLLDRTEETRPNTTAFGSCTLGPQCVLAKSVQPRGELFWGYAIGQTDRQWMDRHQTNSLYLLLWIQPAKKAKAQNTGTKWH